MIIRTGITRTVILTANYAIKVPSLRGGSGRGSGSRLRFWAHGVIANHSEREWSQYEPWQGFIAPVLHSWFWGIVQVYPRCKPMPEGFTAKLPILDPDPGDRKLDNYGLLHGRAVRLDYALE